MLKELLEFIVPSAEGSCSVRIIESHHGLYLEIYDYEHRSWKLYDTIGSSIPRWAETLLRLYLKSLEDTEMLDWLDKQKKPGTKWVCNITESSLVGSSKIYECYDIKNTTIREVVKWHKGQVKKMRWWIKDMEKDIQAENGVCPECTRRLGNYKEPYHPGVHKKDCELGIMLVSFREELREKRE